MRFIGIEKDPKFHADAKERVSFVLARAEEIAGQRTLFDLIMSDDGVI